MSKIPAKALHAHYLFEDGVLEFDKQVEIHVCRFGPNMEKISPDTCPNYPFYQIHFVNPDCYKVYLNSNEAVTSPNREFISAIVANHKQYDLILTSDQEVVDTCPNAKLFPYGSTWLNRGHIDHPDGLGKFDEEYVKEFCEDKEFEVSFLVTSHYKTLDGYELRRNIWVQKSWIQIPTKFYNSTRFPAPDDKSEFLPDDDKRHLFKSQYSIAIENASVENYFTEKLIDCLITKTVPIYFGCPNIGDFFDTRGMIIIEDPNNIDKIIKNINKLTPETYEQMLPYIEENYNRAKEYARSYAERVKEMIEESIKETESTPKLLTIGILTLDNDEERKVSLNRLLSFLNMYTTDENRRKIEIIVNPDDGTKSVGSKRNEILERATGDFVCFIDDDDMVDEEYTTEILKAIEENENIDSIGFSGMYYYNGNQVMVFKHANQYGGHYKDAKGIQYRPCNHLNPVRTNFARMIKFPEQDFGEDSDYCDRLLESKLIRNEFIIENKIMYHYYWSDEGTKTHQHLMKNRK